VIKLRVECCLLHKKNKGRRRNGGEEGCLSSHKLNITNGFKFIDNSVYGNNTLSYFLNFFIPSFLIVILLVNT
jgi:hypothetical protein